MNEYFYPLLFVAVAGFIAAAKWLLGELDGSSYYKRHPGAKVIDELAAKGKLPLSIDPLVKRLADADDLNAKADEIRDELGIRRS